MFQIGYLDPNERDLVILSGKCAAAEDAVVSFSTTSSAGLTESSQEQYILQSGPRSRHVDSRSSVVTRGRELPGKEYRVMGGDSGNLKRQPKPRYAR